MARMQPVLTIGDLKLDVAIEVRRAFPNEEFLDEELFRIVGGALNAFNWGLIRMATEGAPDTVRSRRFQTVETSDHFATRWMSRSDIIQHAMDTTGLSRDVVEYGVAEMENRIDRALRVTDNILFGWVGYIARSNEDDRGYRIMLSDELRF